MPHFVYILRCKDGTLYTGYAKNLERRILEHNNSKQGARYTKARRPVRLVYSESFKSLSLALKREHSLKKLKRAAKLDLIKSAKKV